LFKALEGPGGSSVTPFAVNNSGQIVGDFGAHGFLKDSAGYTTLDADVQGTETEAHGINDSGQIVGTFDTGSNVSGFLKDSAGYTKLYGPYTWGAGTFPYGINNSGQIVGFYLSSLDGFDHGFLWDKGNYATFDVSITGAVDTRPYGINNSGQIVGSYTDASGVEHGFMKDGSGYATLDFPGAVATMAYGINDHGQVVGSYKDAAGIIHGFLWESGVYAALDIPGAFVTDVYGINDSGQIVGWTDAGALVGGFLVSPGPVPVSVQPEPAHPGGLVVTYELFEQLPAGETMPISVYWATGAQGADALSVNAPHGQASGPADALYTYTVDSSLGPGTYTFDVSPDKLLTAPHAARCLLVVADPTDNLGYEGYADVILVVSAHLGNLSGSQLQKLMPGLSAADAGRYAPLLASEMASYGITSLEQEAMFFGQLAVESNNLRTWIEGPSSATAGYFITHYWVCPPNGAGTQNAPYGTKWAGLGDSYPTAAGLSVVVAATGKAHSRQLQLHWSNAAGNGFATVTFTRHGNLFVYAWAGSNQEPKYTTQLLVVDPVTHHALLTIRNRLGEFLPEDASDFRGRGPIQITGRYNYQQLADGAGLPHIMTDPQLVSDSVNHPEIGIEAATWYFSKHGCNAATDRDAWEASSDFNDDITGRINAAYLDQDKRLAQYLRIRALLLEPNL
jgi:probable HAF family extracellular repeat protein